MRPFKYTGAKNTEEALQAANSNEDAHYLGGGTNLLDLMKEDVERPDELIEVASLDYKNITSNENGGLTLGAMLNNSETANHREVRTQYPLLSMAMLSAASAQLRNMATNGGNLLQRTRCPYFYETSMPCNKREPGTGCGALNGMNALHAIFGWSDKCVAVHPSDMCVALAAIGATVEVLQPDGSSRMIEFTDFHRLPGDQPEKDTNLLPGELITAIHLPEPVFADHYYYLKIRERASYAFALVSVAAGLQIKDGVITRAGLALGSVAHKPWKLTEVETYLTGKKPNQENFEAAAGLAMKDAKPLEDNKYKVEMAAKGIVRALTMAYERKA
ncbi:xanthine dehydrogenase family protein subunit M [Antarcticibacterium flavum]|uniref:Xanthine dehydrogenase family protein subunit M n=1 Tax=Antarcticibacterium flavum TaxID=2058175 RepID=A0A5B7WZU8_9FLAO|nr:MULTISPECIES: xanthine dehydrogenase family protein subunit M [Antarcticibacterium]MCM4159842.1 FAD-binding molybdopterin dehydrogenase [Antarcticibacterium sp. W02-3]QCY68844.1 xanthine dehydrogenase family protein subunit M [Antarcticibacterium flavum]